MLNPNLPDPDLLKTLLEPLLDDFQHWFERSRSFLESHSIEFLGSEQQADLLQRVQQAQQEVTTAQLFKSHRWASWSRNHGVNALASASDRMLASGISLSG